MLCKTYNLTYFTSLVGSKSEPNVMLRWKKRSSQTSLYSSLLLLFGCVCVLNFSRYFNIYVSFGKSKISSNKKVLQHSMAQWWRARTLRHLLAVNLDKLLHASVYSSVKWRHWYLLHMVIVGIKCINKCQLLFSWRYTKILHQKKKTPKVWVI